MKFLLKTVFWLTVVVLLLPAGDKRPSAPEVGTAEAVSAATAAVSDMRQFCARQPGACAVGAQAAVAFGQKAQTGAKMLYEFLNERVGPNETGSLTAKSDESAAPRARASQDTLTPADLFPAWRGALPRHEAKPPT